MALPITPMIATAKAVAAFAHCKQRYTPEEDYIVHLEEVDSILCDAGFCDAQYRISAYLHDVVEDSPVSFKLVREYFGVSVQRIVYAVTNERGLTPKMVFDKTVAKLASIPEAIPVKLADKLANGKRGFANPGSKFYAKYKDSYPEFRLKLKEESLRYNHIEGDLQSLWNQLDELFDFK